MSHTPHPSDELLLASIQEKVDASSEDAIVDHLNQCPTCQSRLELLADPSKRNVEICEVLRR